MTRHQKFGFFILLIIVMAGLGLRFVLRTRAPILQENELIASLDQLFLLSHSMDEEEKGEKVDRVHMVKIANQIEKTIRASGTNAIPILLKLLTVPGEEWKANFAFSVLGPTAKPAVPALVEMLKSKNPDVRLAVVYSLGSIGPAAADAVPALIEHVYDNNLYVKINTRHTLSSIHAQSEKVVPLLIESLNELHRTNDSYVASIIALGKFGNEAKTAFPTVLQFLNDTNLAVRALAADALKSIDSEAATKAGVK